MQKPFLWMIVMFTTCSGLWAQDVHWSQYFHNPLYRSPSEAGNIPSDYRATGHYRNQWRSVTVPFSTLQLSGDYRWKNYKDVGFGALFMHDAVGDGQLQTNELMLQASHPITLPMDSLSLRLGIQLGIHHRSLQFDQFYFDNQFVNGSFNPSIASGEALTNDGFVRLNTGLGLGAEYIENNKHKTILNLGFFNLNRPNDGFFGEKVKRPIRTNLFVEHQWKFQRDLTFLPSIQWMKQDGYQSFVLGSQVKYDVVNRFTSYKAVSAGLWFRMRDALYMNVGYHEQNWMVGLSYDFNVSQLVPASKVRGGFEIVFQYLFYKIKAKKIPHRVCPDFI